MSVRAEWEPLLVMAENACMAGNKEKCVFDVCSRSVMLGIVGTDVDPMI